ncbi:glycoside hydrolase family 65 protein [Ramlibacter rhizophilus]|uniref:Glycoside hydrolase family 65 protein n=1 Tax=Ramlibacter rhizophilus TaxID=1781167 RepID=A0A4Z0BE01_9BURK|nr:glycosyl hydrolase family 65 protein [Ramlibacter rhizophilus]TFY97536.1 glycoside hydrolase family 65 protein [Ramlibacter rhizophilus]
MWNAEDKASAGSAWQLAYEQFDPDDEGRREALLALGNGMLVLRAATVHAAQQGPHYPGTYRAGCYERLRGQVGGEPDETDTLVNLPNPLRIDLRLPGERECFRLADAQLLAYRHELDLRAGTSRRSFTWRDTRGRTTRAVEHRLVSMARPQLVSVRLELTALDWEGPVELCAWLDGEVVNDNVARYADYPHEHLHGHRTELLGAGEVALQARTRGSGVALALVQRTRAEGPAEGEPQVERTPRRIATRLVLALHAQATRAVEKQVAVCTSLDPGAGQPLAAARALLAGAPDHAGLLAEHAEGWKRLWERAGLEVADPSTGPPAHLHLFHLLQTASPCSVPLDAGIPARGWHGEAYHGHIFWDEAFVLPFLGFRFPEVSRACLMYRWRRLDAARARARRAGLAGAMFPWRSARDGHEVTPRFQKNMISGDWMRDHTHLQRHVGAAVAWSTWQYGLASGDLAFLAREGGEMILEIARFWASLARLEPASGRYGIRGVIGPDEFHNSYPGRAEPGLDNNAYTNVMAVWTLCCAFELLERLPPEAGAALRERLRLEDAELAHWDTVSRRMVVPFFGDKLIAQYEGFERLAEFDAELLPPELRDQRLDWALHAIGRSTDAYQVTKQADALTLFYLLSEDLVAGLLARLGYAFDRGALLRTARYYMPRTTHRSSLSRVVYAGALAQVAPEESWDLFQHALRTDLETLKGESVAEGIHLAAMGGTLDTLQRRYLGVSCDWDGLCLHPALPPQLGPVRLTLSFRGQRLQVESEGGAVRVRSDAGNRAGVPLRHAQGRLMLGPGQVFELAAA